MYNGCAPRLNQNKIIDYWCTSSLNNIGELTVDNIGYCSGNCSKTTALGNNKTLNDIIRNRFINSCIHTFLLFDNNKSILGVCLDMDKDMMDSRGNKCSNYKPSDCGNYDENDFKSGNLCCSCGGGNISEGIFISLNQLIMIIESL